MRWFYFVSLAITVLGISFYCLRPEQNSNEIPIEEPDQSNVINEISNEFMVEE
jgi:hypothetical protein